MFSLICGIMNVKERLMEEEEEQQEWETSEGK
jgi:hypothetical protein